MYRNRNIQQQKRFYVRSRLAGGYYALIARTVAPSRNRFLPGFPRPPRFSPERPTTSGIHFAATIASPDDVPTASARKSAKPVRAATRRQEEKIIFTISQFRIAERSQAGLLGRNGGSTLQLPISRQRNADKNLLMQETPEVRIHLVANTSWTPSCCQHYWQWNLFDQERSSLYYWWETLEVCVHLVASTSWATLCCQHYWQWKSPRSRTIKLI